jgi:hypothetical protein
MGHTFRHSLKLFCLKSSRWIFTKPCKNFLRFFLSLALAKNVGINFLAIFCLVRAVVVGSFCRNLFGGSYFGGNQFWQEPGGNYFGRNYFFARTTLAETSFGQEFVLRQYFWQEIVLGKNDFPGN